MPYFCDHFAMSFFMILLSHKTWCHCHISEIRSYSLIIWSCNLNTNWKQTMKLQSQLSNDAMNVQMHWLLIWSYFVGEFGIWQIIANIFYLYDDQEIPSGSINALVNFSTVSTTTKSTTAYKGNAVKVRSGCLCVSLFFVFPRSHEVDMLMILQWKLILIIRWNMPSNTIINTCMLHYSFNDVHQ